MITELAGFTLARAIPDEYLVGVMTGAYKVCGGVIRNPSGQIVAHLINVGSSLASAHPVGATVSAAFDALNTVQLYKLGKSIKAVEAATAQLVGLAQGIMALSGLTLGVSAAGFIFLSKKLNQIDQKLNEIAKDMVAILVDGGRGHSRMSIGLLSIGPAPSSGHRGSKLHRSKFLLIALAVAPFLDSSERRSPP
jgi:hypothetical protein